MTRHRDTQAALVVSLLGLLAGYLAIGVGLLTLAFGALAAWRPWPAQVRAGVPASAVAAAALALGLASAGAGLWAVRGASRLRQLHTCFGELPAWGPAPQGLDAGARAGIEAAARQAFAEGDLAKARRLLERWLADAPQDRDAGDALAACLAHQGEYGALDAAAGLAGARGRVAARLKRHGSPSLRRVAAAGLLACALSCPLLGVYAYWALQTVEMLATPPSVRGIPNFYREEGYRVETTDHFEIHYQSEPFLNLVRPLAEEALAEDCGQLRVDVAEYRSRRIQLYLAPSQAAFLDNSPYLQPWQAGVTVPGNRAIYTFPPPEYPQLVMRDTLAHECGHLLFSRLYPDLRATWLEEGLCMYLGTRFLQKALRQPYLPWVARHYLAPLKERRLPFGAFMAAHPNMLKDQADITTFYLQGFSIVALLIEYNQNEGGMERFQSFLGAYSRGHDINAALAQVYGPRIGGLDDLQGMWLLLMT